MSDKIFISHATADDAVVGRLRELFEGAGLPVWVDSRTLRGGDKLKEADKKGVEKARSVLVVLSPSTVNSSWVRDEVKWALEIAKQRDKGGYRVIPILLPGVEPSALELWFDQEPLAIKVGDGPGAIEGALPDLLTALGEQLPADREPPKLKEAMPVADLTLELFDLGVSEVQPGVTRATARAVLVFDPPEVAAPEVRSRPFRFVAPLGSIEADELTWYIERYLQWPLGDVVTDRARMVERDLAAWGQTLFAAALGDKQEGRGNYDAWRHAPAGTERRFSVLVDDNMLEEATDDQKKQARAAAAALLTLPWELIHDGSGFLFAGGKGARVRRRLPNQVAKAEVRISSPLRVLLVSPRPEDERTSYIDHRASALPLVEALSSLGELAELTILSPPTFAALSAELDRAEQGGKPYQVVHFDGHGVFDRARRDGPGGRQGLGALVFEHPDDVGKTFERRSELVDCDKLGGLIKDRRVPLFFLEACQTAQAKGDPTSSVAGTLLQGGAASVAAMSHSVLVETARRFVEPFYRALLQGERVGQAMLAGQKALADDANRGKGFGGEFKLQDWFVPVLFQEETDPQLVRQVPAKRVQEEIDTLRKLALGKLPELPSHGFVGRSRQLLAAERLLLGKIANGQRRFVVLRGEGGEGKTAIGCELARWLVASRRFDRAAFASLEHCAGARALLQAIGEQLVPNFLSEVGAESELEWQFVARALRDRPTLLVIDNVESILPPYGWANSAEGEEPAGFDPELMEEVLELCRKMVETGGTALVFTSRSPLKKPLDDRNRELDVGRLWKSESLELVGRVLGEGGRIPGTRTDLESREKVEELVEVLGGHARGLVLVARELRGGRKLGDTTADVRQIMAELHSKYPIDREQSLFASVELSLRKLPPELRAKLPPLGVFHGGAVPRSIAQELELDMEQGEHETLAHALVEVGLAEAVEYGYHRFDPALAPFLLRELAGPARAAAEARWAEATRQLTVFLYGQQNSNPQMAASLTLHELPNLLAALEWRARAAAEGAFDLGSVIDQANLVESLLQFLGRPRALQRAVAVRERAAAALKDSGWSHARYVARASAIDRLLGSGRAEEAVPASRRLLADAEAAGEGAYEGSDYDLAYCHRLLGEALEKSGDAQAALGPLDDARVRFQRLADAGDKDAARMASVSLSQRADALRALGRLDEAAKAYEEAIKLAEDRGDLRDVAVGRLQLGSLRLRQRRYAEALQAYNEARETFERVGDRTTEAIAWHQMGMALRLAGQYDQAEEAYLNARRIFVELGDRSHEASTLGELGNLHSGMGRLEDAVRFYREAAAIYADPKVNDMFGEGRARHNAANSLRTLGRLDEARRELERAIVCDEPFGHAAEPWKAFDILSAFERDAGRPEAASAARRRAIEAYLAYRRDGGENQSGSAPIYEGLFAAVSTGQVAAWSQALDQLRTEPDNPAYLVLSALRAILTGSRDPTLADDPALRYWDAAELRLVLERLGKPPGITRSESD
jgi:tetratricopeptide (TPR) repeat protein/CHAT domain-containing protein